MKKIPNKKKFAVLRHYNYVLDKREKMKKLVFEYGIV